MIKTQQEIHNTEPSPLSSISIFPGVPAQKNNYNTMAVGDDHVQNLQNYDTDGL